MLYAQTFGDINTASSRLRVFNIQPHIENYVLGSPEHYEKGDVLIIQKIPLIDELRKAQKEGAKVIYDIDDYFWDKKEILQMIREADMVTVDTQEKANFLWQENDNVQVIPDSLDWDGTIKKDYGKGKIIGWLGYGNNSHYLNDIDIPTGAKLRIIADPSWLKYYKDNQAQSRPWSLEMADKYLSECDFSFYYLPEGQFEQVKGEHKLLKSWAVGLPTYTSPMPAYVNAMKKAGLGEKYVVKHKEDWKNLELECDYDDIDKARAYALTYSAENISKLWKEKIASLEK